MKALIIFLSLVFMGCVTASDRNPSMLAHGESKGTADDYEACLSACMSENKTFKECNPICATILGVDLSAVKNKKPLMLAGFEECRNACVADGYDEDGCRNACK